MNSRRWFLIALAGAALLALSAAAAAYNWWYRPRAEDARARAAVEALQLPVVTWHVIYQQGASGLPGPYPGRLDDLAERGLVREDLLGSYRSGIILEYLPPPESLDEEARTDWVVLKATTPRGTWIGTLGGDRRWEPRP